MELLERYRDWYEYEKDCNQKMLAMLESVPEANRNDARFQQAVVLADHLVSCREKWLGFMTGQGNNTLSWWNAQSELATLRPRYASVQTQWTEYLAHLDTDQLAQDFEFTESSGESFRLPIEVQIVQLIGHASYHRGQIALLVSSLGGETVDTDYADWWWVTSEEKP